MTRHRFEIAWTLNRADAPRHLSDPESLRAHFTTAIHMRFLNYRPDLLDFRVADPSAERLDFRIVWSVEMDLVPGAWHNPDDHAMLIRAELTQPFAGQDPQVSVSHIQADTEAA